MQQLSVTFELGATVIKIRMEKTIQISIFLTVVFGFNFQPGKQLLSTIQVGAYSYKIYKHRVFVHDEHRSMDFFAVYGNNDRQQCSASMLDTVNGTIKVKGQFSFNKKYLEFREYYTTTIYDSVIKRFYPNKSGNLILLRFITYKNGVEKITKY